ncbi:hypothetical protein [Streptomyces sp. MST-110588]|nr:hypothetical protein [Streptomyces sp. MST-110588]UNO41099.1 hypothetical protein KGS77_17795 [Streptomyces sp. MST-110588]
MSEEEDRPEEPEGAAGQERTDEEARRREELAAKVREANRLSVNRPF